MQDASKTSDIGSSLNQSWKSITESCNRLLSNPQGTLRSAAVGVVGKLIQPILKGRSITNPVHDHDDLKLPNTINQKRQL
jgi:chromosome condensin MukBEF complex kleisin-like MukF subunit